MSMTIRNKEDLLLFSKWFKELLAYHFPSRWPFNLNVKVETHIVTANKLEVDVLVRDLKDSRKVIAIELKESDIDKAIQQALKRKEVFNYVYVAINLPTASILAELRRHPEALENGIGFISTYDDCIVIRAYSHKKKESKRYLNLLELVKTIEKET